MMLSIGASSPACFPRISPSNRQFSGFPFSVGVSRQRKYNEGRRRRGAIGPMLSFKRSGTECQHHLTNHNLVRFTLSQTSLNPFPQLCLVVRRRKDFKTKKNTPNFLWSQRVTTETRQTPPLPLQHRSPAARV